MSSKSLLLRRAEMRQTASLSVVRYEGRGVDIARRIATQMSFSHNSTVRLSPPRHFPATSSKVDGAAAVVDAQFTTTQGGNLKSRSVLEYWVTPLAYGAKFDGINDDTAAIQAAINTGRSVQFPPGVAKITDKLTISQISGVRYRGAGRGVTEIRQYTDNCQIFYLSGTRLEFEGMRLTWNSTQTSAHVNSSAFDVWDKSITNAILATTHFRSIDIRNCAKGFDFGNSIGYSCTFIDIGINSFAISAFYCDAGTAWTQCRFDTIYIANQPQSAYTGTAVGGSTTTIVLPAGASATDDFYKGMPLVITGGSGSSGTVYWITAYVGATRTATFYSASGVAIDATSTFQIARIAVCSDFPMKFVGFTDLHIGAAAFEFLRLPSGVSVPISFESCLTVVVCLIRYERINFSAPKSALISVSGRSVVTILSMQTQVCAALTQMGVTDVYYGRTYAQGVLRFQAIPETDTWRITANIKWALASAAQASDRTERPFGGVVFGSIRSGDQSFSPFGQDYDFAGPRRQTAIIGRPPGEQRGVSFDEGNIASFTHNLMESPDVIRFNTALTQSVTFNLDQSQMVAGAPVTVFRDAGCTGSFDIVVKYQSTTLATLSSAGQKSSLVCHGQGYYVT